MQTAISSVIKQAAAATAANATTAAAAAKAYTSPRAGETQTLEAQQQPTPMPSANASAQGPHAVQGATTNAADVTAQPVLRARAAQYLAILQQPCHYIIETSPDAIAIYSRLLYNTFSSAFGFVLHVSANIIAAFILTDTTHTVCTIAVLFVLHHVHSRVHVQRMKLCDLKEAIRYASALHRFNQLQLRTACSMLTVAAQQHCQSWLLWCNGVYRTALRYPVSYYYWLLKLPSVHPDDLLYGLKSLLQLRVTRTMLRLMVDGTSDATTAATIAMEIPEHTEHPIVQLVYDATAAAAAAAAASSSSSSSQALLWTASAAAEIAKFPPRVTTPIYNAIYISQVHITSMHTDV
eukprot:6040-Heterococcus_DN1.PRE.2